MPWTRSSSAWRLQLGLSLLERLARIGIPASPLSFCHRFGSGFRRLPFREPYRGSKTAVTAVTSLKSLANSSVDASGGGGSGGQERPIGGELGGMLATEEFRRVGIVDAEGRVWSAASGAGMRVGVKTRGRRRRR
jgi:hypothetical protein